MQTLFVSDLDGTLFDPSGHISPKTASTLNRLIGQGALFSIATARSPMTAKPLLTALELCMPCVLLNGVFLYDLKNDRAIHYEPIAPHTVTGAVSIFEAHGKSPFLYTYDGTQMRSLFTTLQLDVQKEFYEERRTQFQKRFVQLDALRVPPGQDAIYFSLIDTRQALAPIKKELEEMGGLNLAFYPDNYSDYWYLECFSCNASKKSGVRRLKTYTGAEHICAFGDNYNDLPMFEAADEAYAVANACDALKAAATGIIGANSMDGVACYLENRLR